MADKRLKGVGGVLGNLISPEPAEVELPARADEIPQVTPVAEAAPPEAKAQPPLPAPAEKPRPKATVRVAARRGRPPGQKPGEAVDKEKVTLRLNKELMDDYREWSWEERCQIGELVERALIHYRKNQSRQKSQ